MSRWLPWFARTVLPPLLVAVLFIAALEAIVHLQWVSPRQLPPPSSVYRVFFPADLEPAQMLRAYRTREQLLGATFNTAKGALLGFGLSVGIGTLVALLLSTGTWVRRAFYPYAVLFQTVPIIAVAPLLIIWFDYGLKVVVASSFIASVFPVVANTLTGLLSVDPAHRDLFRLYGARLPATVFKLYIPSALPAMFTGYRIAGGLAVIGAIVGEFVSSGAFDSLGGVIDTNRTMLRTDVVFAAVLLASVLGIALFTALNLLSRLLLRHWHASEQGR
jgi:NitT/TauT family transport system permease protein